MSEVINGKPPVSFWVIGAAALVWNLIGLIFYYGNVTMSPEVLQGFSADQQEFLTTTPKWSTSAYAIAVTAGVLGSLLLLLRKTWAAAIFVLSFVAIIVQDVHVFLLSNWLEAWGTEGIIMPAIVVVIGAALIWYSRLAKDKGWIA